MCININGLRMCTKLVKQNSRSGTERGGQEGNKIARNSWWVIKSVGPASTVGG